MFPCRDGFQNDAFGRIAASDQLHDNVDRRIGENLLCIGREQARRQRNTSVACHIEVGNTNKLDRHTDPAADQGGILQQNLCDTHPNRSEPNDADAHTRHHGSEPSSFRVFRMPRTACLVRCSFSTRPNRTYSSPPSPNPIPGDTATFASRSKSFENSSDPRER